MKRVSAQQVNVITGTLDSHFLASRRAIYCNFVQQMFSYWLLIKMILTLLEQRSLKPLDG